MGPEHQALFNDKASIQFAGILGDSAYLFTNPKLVPVGDGAQYAVVASLGDKIGRSSPVKIPFASFHGHFTSLVVCVGCFCCLPGSQVGKLQEPQCPLGSPDLQ